MAAIEESRSDVAIMDLIRDVLRSVGQQTVQMALREEPNSFDQATQALIMSLFD